MSHIKCLNWAKTLLILLLCGFGINANAQLAGSYTIGGASPDYATIDNALTALETNGVSAAVTFNIRTGTYTEHLTLGNVAGTSGSNTVTFQAESGDSSDVVITYTATSDADAWTFRIDSADYISLKHLTLSNTASVGTSVIWFQGEAHHIEVSNCKLIGPSEPYYAQHGANVYSATATKDTATTIVNNLLIGNDMGVKLGGQAFSAHEPGHVVSDNTLVGQTRGGIDLYANNNVVCHNNDMNLKRGGVGLSFTFVNGTLSVQGNKVVQDSIAGSGMWLNGVSVTAGWVYNNYIYVHPSDGYGGSQGMFITSSGGTSGGFINIYHNTVDVVGVEQFYDAAILSLSNAGNSSIHLKNNVLSAENCLVYNVIDPIAFGTNDYNGLWTSGDAFAIWGTNAPVDFASFQSLSGKETNSAFAQPYFVAPGDFHLIAAGGYDGGGTSLIGQVAFDCDGEARNASTPDVGCDEFASPATELAVLSIDSLGGSCSDTVFAYATIQNIGSSATTVSLTWTLNAISQGMAWYNDTLQPGETGVVLLGSISQQAGVSYAVAAYPTSGGGAITANDTATTTFSKALAGGTYTIGGASPDFATISDAATAISAGGICGPVVFDIRTGTYNEQVCVGSVSGVSASNTITFQAESGDSTDVTVTYAATGTSDNFVWKFDGTDFVTLQRVSIMPTGSSYGHGVILDGGASQFTLTNCYLKGDSIPYQNEEKELVFASGPFHHDVTIHHNRFHLGDRAVNLKDAFNNPERATGVAVFNNYFLNNAYAAVNIENMASPRVESNYVNGSAPTPGYSGITFYQCIDSVSIEGNEIYIGVGGAQYGINIWACEGTVNSRMVVANNAVSMPLDVNGAYGIEIGPNCYYTDVFHNSSYIRYVGVTNPTSYALDVWGFNSRVYNNNCFSEHGYAFGLFFNTVLDSADNNNYYSKTTSFIRANFADYTLADYQTLVGGEANTVQVNPKFAAWNDLRTNAQELDDAGDPLPAFTTDISGAPRSLTTPDIGAYEFTHVPFVCAQAINLKSRQVQDVTARLEWDAVAGATGYKVFLKVAGNATWDTVLFKNNNQGVMNLTGLTPGTIYKWTVSTHCGTQCAWSDPVLPIERFVTLTQPCAAPAALSTSPIRTDKARLNWTPSVNAQNNVIRWREQGAGSWQVEIKDGLKTVHWLTGLTAATTYEWQVRTRCAKDNSSNTGWSSLQVFSTPTNKFEDDSNMAQSEESILLLYPNPVHDQLQLYAVEPGADGTLEIQLFDASGRLILARRATLVEGEVNTTFDVSNLEKGIYFVRITGAARWSERVVID